MRSAFQEMHRSGFRSADLNAISATARVTKGALYHHFDNKEALGYCSRRRGYCEYDPRIVGVAIAESEEDTTLLRDGASELGRVC